MLLKLTWLYLVVDWIGLLTVLFWCPPTQWMVAARRPRSSIEQDGKLRVISLATGRPWPVSDSPGMKSFCPDVWSRFHSKGGKDWTLLLLGNLRERKDDKTTKTFSVPFSRKRVAPAKRKTIPPWRLVPEIGASRYGRHIWSGPSSFSTTFSRSLSLIWAGVKTAGCFLRGEHYHHF